MRVSLAWVNDWRGLVVALVGLGVWVATVQATVNKTQDLQRIVDQDHLVVQALGRLECIRDRHSAGAAGLPCAWLLGEVR